MHFYPAPHCTSFRYGHLGGGKYLTVSERNYYGDDDGELVLRYTQRTMHNKTPAPSGSASRKSLASEDVVSAIVYQLLETASAGGMTESRAEELYNEIMSCYANLDASRLAEFRRKFHTILQATNAGQN